MSAKDQIKQLVDYFKSEPRLEEKTDAMGDGLMLGANLADEANERSKESADTAVAIQERYKEQILAQDLNPNKDPEVVDARNGYETLGEQSRDVKAQLLERAQEIIELFHLNIGYTTLEFHGAQEGEDSAQALEEAIAQFEGKPGEIIFSGNKTYHFSRTVHIPFNISIDLGLSKIAPMESGEYLNGFLFYVNADYQGKTIEKWGGEYIATIHRGRFVNDINYSGIKGIYSKSKTNFEDITFDNFSKGFLKDGAVDADYSDMITLRKLYFINCQGIEPLIDIRYNGDGLLIDGCHVAGGTDKNHNLLYLYGCNGGKITRCTNGDITILGSSAISLDAFHCEQGKINVANTTISIKDIFQMYNVVYQKIPLTIKNSQFTIDNYVVAYVQDNVRSGTGLQKNYTAADSIDAFIEKSSGEIRNFFRRYYSSLGTGLGMKTAVKVSTNGTSINYDWESNSQLYSKASTVISNQFYSHLKGLKFDKNFVTSSTSITDHGSFDESPGMYYYRVVPYFGPINRKIAKFAGNEVVATITSEQDYPLINMQEDSELQYSKIRLYRGEAPGSYSHYVDIPVGSSLAVYDNGYYISTGERWRARGWSGQEDAYNMFFTKIELRGENVTVYGDRLPTHGKWTLGDVVVVSNTQGDQEHVCTKTGDFSGTAPIFKQRM